MGVRGDRKGRIGSATDCEERGDTRGGAEEAVRGGEEGDVLENFVGDGVQTHHGGLQSGLGDRGALQRVLAHALGDIPAAEF